MFSWTISRWSTNSNQKWHKTLNSFFEKKFWHFSESKNDNDLNSFPFPSSPSLPSLPFSLPPLPPPTLTTAAALQRMRGMQHHSKGGSRKAAPPKKNKGRQQHHTKEGEKQHHQFERRRGKQHNPERGGKAAPPTKWKRRGRKQHQPKRGGTQPRWVVGVVLVSSLFNIFLIITLILSSAEDTDTNRHRQTNKHTDTPHTATHTLPHMGKNASRSSHVYCWMSVRLPNVVHLVYGRRGDNWFPSKIRSKSRVCGKRLLLAIDWLTSNCCSQ